MHKDVARSADLAACPITPPGRVVDADLAAPAASRDSEKGNASGQLSESVTTNVLRPAIGTIAGLADYVPYPVALIRRRARSRVARRCTPDRRLSASCRCLKILSRMLHRSSRRGAACFA